MLTPDEWKQIDRAAGAIVVLAIATAVALIAFGVVLVWGMM